MIIRGKMANGSDVMRSLVLLLVMTTLAIVVTIDGRQVDEDFYDELLRGSLL